MQELLFETASVRHVALAYMHKVIAAAFSMTGRAFLEGVKKIWACLLALFVMCKGFFFFFLVEVVEKFPFARHIQIM